MASKSRSFLPPRLRGSDGTPVDGRVTRIFEDAALLAHGRRSLLSTDGVRALWRTRKNGVIVIMDAATPADRLTQVLQIEVRWRRATVFKARFAGYLLGPTPRQRHDFATMTYVPGEWESLLAAASGGAS